MQEKIQQKITEIPKLATLPSVALELLQIIEDEDVSVQRIKGVLETDPSLTVKLLHIANSPFYGVRGKIHSIEQALAIIGLNQLTNILVSISLHSRLYHGRRPHAAVLEKLWHHAVACAYVARSLSSKYYVNTAGREYVGGLLHDIGKIVLIEYFDGEMQRIREVIEREKVSDLEAENEVLGITHQEVGLYLAEAWGLPSSFKNVIQFHHFPQRDRSTPVLSAVIHVGDLLCQRWGVSVDEGESRVALMNDEGWQILIDEHPNLAHIDPERVAYEIQRDIQSARLFSDGTIKLRKDELQE